MGGVVNPTIAKARNEKLIEQVQNLREVFGDLWLEVELIQASNCKPRSDGVFENEISILMGSNSKFLKENRSMSNYLNVDDLYLAPKYKGRALKLIPLIKIGSSPDSEKNACYFYNRIEKNEIRYISYHFSDSPERLEKYINTDEVVKFISEM